MSPQGEALGGRSTLVTGGAGFVGSTLVHALVKVGARVRVFDNFSTGIRENLAGLEPDIEIIEGDILDFESLLKAAEGVDTLFHQAAIASVPQSIEDTLHATAVNETGTLHALEAAARQGVRRFVFASSASVYGDGHEGLIGEDTTIDPHSPYAASKAAGELMCRAYSHSKGLETACLRYFNIFGPRQDPSSHYAGVIPIFIEALRRGEALTVFGDGLQTRDFNYVGDIVQANLLAALSPHGQGTPINIGSGVCVTIRALAARLAEVSGLPLTLNFAPPRPGDVRYSTADISRARALLGFEPHVDFETGLSETFRWFDAR